MTKREFYHTMETMCEDKSFETLRKKWKDCFTYMLKSFNAGFTDESIDFLFERFDMENSKMFWIENHPDYRDHTNEELVESFCGECLYISDRYSLDRIFRTHWLFLWGFQNEMYKLKYPELYT